MLIFKKLISSLYIFSTDEVFLGDTQKTFTQSTGGRKEGALLSGQLSISSVPEENAYSSTIVQNKMPQKKSAIINKNAMVESLDFIH